MTDNPITDTHVYINSNHPNHPSNHDVIIGSVALVIGVQAILRANRTCLY